MAAGVYDIKVEQGVAYSFNAIYKDKNNQIVPLTGYSAVGSIKLKMSDTEPLAFFNCTVVPAEGKVIIKLPYNALDHVKVKGNKHNDYVEAVYDIKLVKSAEDPEPIRFLNGSVLISPKVT